MNSGKAHFLMDVVAGPEDGHEDDQGAGVPLL